MAVTYIYNRPYTFWYVGMALLIAFMAASPPFCSIIRSVSISTSLKLRILRLFASWLSSTGTNSHSNKMVHLNADYCKEKSISSLKKYPAQNLTSMIKIRSNCGNNIFVIRNQRFSQARVSARQVIEEMETPCHSLGVFGIETRCMTIMTFF
jgi:hypothetical protein